MGDAAITPEVLAASTVVEEDGDLYGPCGTCAEPFVVGDQMLTVRAPEFDRVSHGPGGASAVLRAVEDIHLRCYQGETLRHG